MRSYLLACTVALALASSACGGGGGGGAAFGDPQDWGFNFWADAERTVLMDTSLVTMEATRSITPGRVDIQIPGCAYALNFDVQFSGSLVRMLNFRVTLDSTCAGIQQTSEGTGTANGSYGNATSASGSGSILYNSPAGPAGGPFWWDAFLQP